MRACIHGCMSAVARCVRRPARGMTPRARQVVGNEEEIERRRPPPHRRPSGRIACWAGVKASVDSHGFASVMRPHMHAVDTAHIANRKPTSDRSRQSRFVSGSSH